MPGSTPGISIAAAIPETPVAAANTNCRRRINPQAGRALEVLGHAIEYLADEYGHDADGFRPDDPRLQAIQLLMALNREIYSECPVVPLFADRWRAFLCSHLAE